MGGSQRVAGVSRGERAAATPAADQDTAEADADALPAPPAVGMLADLPPARRAGMVTALARSLGNWRAQRVIGGWRGAPLQREPDPPGASEAGPNQSFVYQSERVRGRAAAIEALGGGDKADSKGKAGDLEYYDKVIPAVIGVAQARGIPLKNALIIMTQAQAEHGKKIPAGNMIFGITTNEKDPNKVVVTKTWEVVNGKRVERTGRFKRFDTPEASVEGYLDLLSGKDAEFPGMYKGGKPAQILMESDADPEKFKEEMIKGGYSTNPDGYDKEIPDPNGGPPKKIRVPGYRQVFPKLYGQIKGELKTVLPALVNQTRAKIDVCKAQKDAYSELISELSAEIERSSDDPEDEKIRQDLHTLRLQLTRLDEQMQRLEEKLKKYQAFQGALA
jgi:flagellum-specific peptidoglycan hydrolase FlgJ